METLQQNLNLVEQFSRGVTSTEAEIITTGANIAGINNGG